MKNKIVFIVLILLIIAIVGIVLIKPELFGIGKNQNSSNIVSNETVADINNNSKNENTTSEETNSDKPYIPEGFAYVEGEVDNGYTIEDDCGNQYIWVPVKKGKLKRNNEDNSNYEETNGSALELVNSVAQNYGFYVAKYEASIYDLDGNEAAASREGESPITNITYLEASDMSAKVADEYGYDGCCTAIMNSYAWDTIMSWIDKSNEGYSSSTEYGNYSGDINKTGKTETDIKNNICDLSGNLREWTTEVYKSKEETETNTSSSNATNEAEVKDTSKYRVVRGGSAILSTTANSRSKYKENTSNDYWGFRVILYKK